tara:strand:+ start:4334 stop:4495 length:162 start_codon:yes stop_codon:yes gene_type:complete
MEERRKSVDDGISSHKRKKKEQNVFFKDKLKFHCRLVFDFFKKLLLAAFKTVK